MSSIARIFIVLNLLLAALALGWASNHLSSAQNWKTKHDELATAKQQELDALNEDLKARNAEIATLKESSGRFRDERDQIKNINDRNIADLAAEKDTNSQLRASVDGINQNMAALEQARSEAQTKYEQAMAELQAAKDARREAEATAQSSGDAQRDAEEALAAAERRIVELETETTTLAKNLEKTQTTLDVVIAETGVDPTVLMVQPEISGAIVTVSNAVKPGLVGINRGRADGVQRGFEFSVYNGNQYKGTVRVETVEDNMCFATIKSVYQDRAITQGDKATTRL
ncbi:MAG: hypothetical protein H6830_11440 [Planctomycetes bacterium]|nr:hypothetical protein [Planctomycetota bacterium]MCB9908719.1 hypothetical protein [Planctomycetota bacterium]HPF14797.1 hypothetical protein [Planctomycetota bacterium]HRV82188.1 hypothetical protein [Planctomycetota bacterium]